MRSLILFACLAAAVPAAAEPVRFQQDGVRYEYSVENLADGTRVIAGRNLTRGLPFRLEVRGRDVTGRVGSDQVAFQTRAAPPAAPTQIASK